jgi:hypothetical protein
MTMNLVHSEWPWYVAQLVVESQIEGESESVILIESILIHAESPDMAFGKAEELCASSDHVYRNSNGEMVSQRYVGIHDLDNLQAEQLTDGLVLQVRAHPSGRNVRSRNELSLFGGTRPEFSRLNQ